MTHVAPLLCAVLLSSLLIPAAAETSVLCLWTKVLLNAEVHRSFLRGDPGRASPSLRLYHGAWSEERALLSCAWSDDAAVIHDYLSACQERAHEFSGPADGNIDAESMLEADQQCVSVDSLERAGRSVRSIRGHTAADNDQGQAESSEVSGHQRVKRGFIVPGTLWCGSGNKAPSYADLGVFSDTDSCCREHDQCQHTILSFHSQFGVFNSNIFTMSHCDCDSRFHSCLMEADDSIADVVGYTFFSLLKMHCFEFSHRLQCTERNWFGMCKETEMSLYAVVQPPTPYDSPDPTELSVNGSSTNTSAPTGTSPAPSPGSRPVTTATTVTPVTNITSVTNVTSAPPITTITPITTVTPVTNITSVTNVTSAPPITTITPITTVTPFTNITSVTNVTSAPPITTITPITTVTPFTNITSVTNVTSAPPITTITPITTVTPFTNITSVTNVTSAPPITTITPITTVTPFTNITSVTNVTSAPPITTITPITTVTPFTNITSVTNVTSAPPITTITPITTVTPFTNITSVTNVTSAPPITTITPITSVTNVTSAPPITTITPITTVTPFTNITSVTNVTSVPPISTITTITNITSRTNVPQITNITSVTSVPPITTVTNLTSVTSVAASTSHRLTAPERGNGLRNTLPAKKRTESGLNFTEKQPSCSVYKDLDECSNKIPPQQEEHGLYNAETRTLYQCDCTSRLFQTLAGQRRLSEVQDVLLGRVSLACFLLPDCSEDEICSAVLVRADLPEEAWRRSGSVTEERRHLQAVRLKAGRPNRRRAKRRGGGVGLHRLCRRLVRAGLRE